MQLALSNNSLHFAIDRLITAKAYRGMLLHLKDFITKPTTVFLFYTIATRNVTDCTQILSKFLQQFTWKC